MRQAAGPVYGSWRGTQPGPITNYPKEVELVLNGLPGAQSGTYRIASTQQGPGATVDSGTRRWGDSWSSEQRVEDGIPQTIIHLHNTLPGDISTYAVAADGTLRVVHPNGQVDRSRREILCAVSRKTRRALRPGLKSNEVRSCPLTSLYP